jgi:hypothetical protein
VYVRLTPEQVAWVIQGARAGTELPSLGAQLSELALRQAIPPVPAWEECEHAAVQSQCSLALLRGLRLLACLAAGQPASLDDLAIDLSMSPSAVRAYIQALVIVGMVECEPDIDVYRLVK